MNLHDRSVVRLVEGATHILILLLPLPCYPHCTAVAARRRLLRVPPPLDSRMARLLTGEDAMAGLEEHVRVGGAGQSQGRKL